MTKKTSLIGQTIMVLALQSIPTQAQTQLELVSDPLIPYSSNPSLLNSLQTQVENPSIENLDEVISAPEYIGYLIDSAASSHNPVMLSPDGNTLIYAQHSFNPSSNMVVRKSLIAGTNEDPQIIQTKGSILSINTIGTAFIEGNYDYVTKSYKVYNWNFNNEKALIFDSGTSNAHYTDFFMLNDSSTIALGNQLTSDRNQRALTWSQQNGITQLEIFDEFDSSYAISMSRDGNTIVGFLYSGEIQQPAKWVNSQLEVLEVDQSGTVSDRIAPTHVNHDGSVIFAQAGNIYDNEFGIYRWTEETNFVKLDISEIGIAPNITDISFNGGAIIGTSYFDVQFDPESIVMSTAQIPFYWSESSGFINIVEPQLYRNTHFNALSDNGLVAVGWHMDFHPVETDVFVFPFVPIKDTAIRWSLESGTTTIKEWIEKSGVSVEESIQLSRATSVSANGDTIAGTGQDENGSDFIWVARSKKGILSMDNNLSQSFSSSGFAFSSSAQQGTTLLQNGVHHRILMDNPMLDGPNNFWITGDFAKDNDRNTNSSLGEFGLSKDFRKGTVRAGFGLGYGSIDQDLPFEGNTEIDGQHLYGELNLSPKHHPLIYSINLISGDWDADIYRGYLNGGLQDSSTGHTNIDTLSSRLRVDWKDFASMGDFSFDTNLAFTWSQSEMDAYIETEGGFPAEYDAQSHIGRELRLGLSVNYIVSRNTTFRTSLELAHQLEDDVLRVSGSIIGDFEFDLPLESEEDTWARIGFDLSHKLGNNQSMLLTLHLSDQGADATTSGSAQYRFTF
ncbi:autotransporter outer membrane beta-barrel domain-containing protein [Puniceicoccaceae bacterium K14]|nr:autotransporter outer membrane beta-barrel domain-containing protein [Puniceicoccaceae bacterium K14]